MYVHLHVHVLSLSLPLSLPPSLPPSLPHLSNKHRILFEKPVLLTADHWYTAFAAISSPSGASSDAGSSGQREIQGPEK